MQYAFVGEKGAGRSLLLIILLPVHLRPGPIIVRIAIRLILS